MKEKPIKKSISIDSIFIGEEPIWNEKGELPFIRALNWYSNNKDPKDSKIYALEYLKQNNYNKEILLKISLLSEDVFSNFGFVCRMKSRGATLSSKQEYFIEEKINQLFTFEKQKNTSALSPEKSEKKEFNIQDRIFDQATQYINEIEGHVDFFIKNKECKFKCYEYLTSNSIKPIYTKQIIDHYSPLMSEINDTLNKIDEQLVESYSHWNKKELLKYQKFISAIIADCENYGSNTKTVRKTRKKKAISADKKISKLNYKKEDLQYKIVSINPTEIIAAKQLWVFNTKTKKLGWYVSKDEAGFSVKGTTIEGFDETFSVQKTLRKPEEQLKSVLDKKISNKKFSKDYWNSIKSVENTLTGRINADVVILKVVK